MKSVAIVGALIAMIVPASAETYKITVAQAMNLYNGLSNIDQPYTAIDKENKQYQARHKFGKDGVDRERIQWAMAKDLEHLRPIVARAQREQQLDQMDAEADMADADIVVAQANCPGDGDKAAPSVDCLKARRAKMKIASDDARKGDCLLDQIETIDLEPVAQSDLALKDNDLSALSMSALLFFDTGQPVLLNPKCATTQ